MEDKQNKGTTLSDLGYDKFGMDPAIPPSSVDTQKAINQRLEQTKLIKENRLLDDKLTKSKLGVELVPRQPVVESKLLSIIPEDKAHKPHRRMAELFIKDNKVKNHLLARCIKPTISQSDKRRKLGMSDYKNNKKSYDEEIQNRVRVLRRLWKPLGHTVGFNSKFCELVAVKKPIPRAKHF